jgi:hypothetical protein
MDNEELNNAYKQNAFKVPENYFETFDDKVMARLYKKDKQVHTILAWKRWGIAASLFIVASATVFLYMNRSQAAVDIASATISDAELERFRNEAEVNEEEFLELLSTQAIDSIYQLEVVSVSNTTFSEEETETIEEEYSPLDEIEI